MKDKIEVKKITKIDGEVWYYLYVNDSIERCFLDFKEAEKVFNQLLKNIMQTTEIVLTNQ